jgi:hypothetical protein
MVATCLQGSAVFLVNTPFGMTEKRTFYVVWIFFHMWLKRSWRVETLPLKSKVPSPHDSAFSSAAEQAVEAAPFSTFSNDLQGFSGHEQKLSLAEATFLDELSRYLEEVPPEQRLG